MAKFIVSAMIPGISDKRYLSEMAGFISWDMKRDQAMRLSRTKAIQVARQRQERNPDWKLAFEPE